ncbi:hypothetical protein EZV62_006109 [Acer yangbiense]|uniref:Ion transport domain-containing protein n=1 Tax=Acer yangbiense TaxID=1000413 RepID=A0A5C7IQT2_9ROSI|nr:hypothetical protein EZV62_006109 [Acer yangbiense]
MKAGWSYVKKTLKGSTGNWITFVLWIISISLDPIICYVPSIYDEKMMFKINSPLLISIWVLYWSLLMYRISISFCENERKLQIFNQAESVALLLSNLFGGLWYLFAVWKKLACWKHVCSKNANICHYDYANNRFNVSEGNKLLNDNCFANKTEDPYELGIFKDAFASRIVEETTELWKKLLYCFRWGIQNISGFGTNLQVSTYAWENIFVILIVIYGVGTFTFFIGNMQNLMKSAIDERRKNEDRVIKQQLQQWFSFGKISENLQNCIKEYHQYNGQQTRGVDVKSLCRNLPKDVGNNLKHKLCLELKKKKSVLY